jgi:hypothetical protein
MASRWDLQLHIIFLNPNMDNFFIMAEQTWTISFMAEEGASASSIIDVKAYLCEAPREYKLLALPSERRTPYPPIDFLLSQDAWEVGQAPTVILSTSSSAASSHISST